MLIAISIKKVVIACPVTLCENWKKEFRKWCVRTRRAGNRRAMSDEIRVDRRINVVVADGTDNQISGFVS